MSRDVEGPVGVHPSVSILYAQVWSGKPRMSIDDKGFLTSEEEKISAGKIYLGDVAESAIRSLGPHGTPEVTEESYDEQKWKLVCRSNELKIKISSESYWGFGLFAKCFLNKIILDGPLSSRARCIHEIVATLGRNPWEPIRVRAFERKTKASISAHAQSWESLISFAKDEFLEIVEEQRAKIRKLRGLGEENEYLIDNAEIYLDEALMALSDKNIPAVERALSRASNSIIQFDPSTEVYSANRELLEN
ncbi:MAG: hypothetical protein CL993_01980 [Euryarchaeota archaeon]|nr:hypothetical protein [Euryarchaeota archaeon]